MPTRVLAICKDDTRTSVRLVETRDQEGRYIALSHCWGSKGKQPLRTTSKNLESHRSGIPFEDLPRTFQDCVEFSHGMGVEYVWIDSLCIIQDDNQDWHSEAAKMGDVYANAAIVVAASGAKDSSEGLFITNRPRARILRLPYRVHGEVQGTFNMMQLFGEWDPKSGPLETRAWTLQERCLARRFLAFMPNGITWICKDVSIDEAGRQFKGFNEEYSWLWLLHTFTTRSLTVPSDRPEAIKGIAGGRKLLRSDRYVAEYGVWEEHLVHQLLWMSNGPNFDDDFDDGRLPNSPSWSWITTKDVKQWPYQVYDGSLGIVQQSEEMSTELVITPAGNLHLLGHLSSKELARSHAHDASTLPELKLGDIGYSHDHDPHLARIITQDMHDARHQTVLGIVRPDYISTALYTHVCFLVKEELEGTEDVNVEQQTIVRSNRLDLCAETNIR